MYLLSIMLATLAIAAPLTGRDTPAITNSTQEFKLQICLPSGASDINHFEGLWLEGYHTGAGLNDVVFNSNQSQAAKAWINNTANAGTVVFDLGTEFPWSFYADESPDYSVWTEMHINAGSPNQRGYFINDTGLQWNGGYVANTTEPYNSFGGWLGKSTMSLAAGMANTKHSLQLVALWNPSALLGPRILQWLYHP